MPSDRPRDGCQDAAGEFLEGGAAVSEERLKDSLHFLRLFRVGDVGVETAARYARIVA